MGIFALISFLDPFVKIWYACFSKNKEEQKANMAAYYAWKTKMCSSTTKSYDMKTNYDQDAAEQDKRISELPPKTGGQ
jgi:hypothetical protein